MNHHDESPRHAGGFLFASSVWLMYAKSPSGVHNPHGRDYESRSMIIAMPCPPPTHIVSRPNVLS
jgi:hypothetical protein